MSGITAAASETAEKSKEKHREWAERLFSAIDRRDLDAFLSFLMEDVRFTFGNLPTIVGHAGIREFFNAPAPYLATRHTILGVWEEHGTVIVESSAEYTRFDNTTLTLPGIGIFRLEGKLIGDYRVFTDGSPLFS